MSEEVKYFNGDAVLAFAERTIKRLWIAVILLIVMLVASNALWIWNEAQYVDEQVEVIQRNEDGYNSYIGNDGDINYGYVDGNADGYDSYSYVFDETGGYDYGYSDYTD